MFTILLAYTDNTFIGYVHVPDFPNVNEWDPSLVPTVDAGTSASEDKRLNIYTAESDNVSLGSPSDSAPHVNEDHMFMSLPACDNTLLEPGDEISEMEWMGIAQTA